MRHRLSGKKLSRPTGHRSLMLRGMVTDLLRHEAIQTTEAKAREVRRMAEKVITRGKKNTLHSRRLAATVLTDGRVLRKLFDELVNSATQLKWITRPIPETQPPAYGSLRRS